MIKFKNIKLIKAIITIFLYFFGSLFRLIPCLIFNLNYYKISGKTSMYLTLFEYIILITIFFFMYKKDIINYIKDFKNNFSKDLDIGFKYWLIGIIIMVICNLLINRLFPKSNPGNEETIQALIKTFPYLTLIATSIGAPIIEEITFRKTFRDIFKNDKVFIIVSGVVFGLLHVVFSYTNAYDLLYAIPYGVLGAVFAIMYVKSNNLFTSMSMHFIHNFTLTLISILTISL